MNRDVIRTAVCAAVACFTFSAANAHEPLARVHDKQSGAAALTTAFHIVDKLSWEMTLLVKLAQDKADIALKPLSILTTPANLQADPDGIEVPCATSGSFTAKLPAGYPRRLHIEFQNCAYEEYGGVLHTLNGPARIGLLRDSFAATIVSEIRLGTPSRNVVETLDLLHATDIPTIHTFNSSIRGLISLQRDPIFEHVVGSFSYRFDGFFDEQYFVHDTSGQVLALGLRLTADDLIASGSQQTRRTDSEYLLDGDITFVAGAITYTSRSGDQAVTQYQTFDRLDIQKTSSLSSGREQSLELNGGTSYFYDESAGPSCLDGKYRFTTVAPIQYVPEGYDKLDVQSGELQVNHALTATFSPSDPRLTMRIGAHTFTLDPVGGGLQAAAGCFPF